MANYLTYPCTTMNITQNYNGNFSHKSHINSNINDFPIDEACSDSGRSWFCCPCDEMIIKRIYGVGGRGTNTVWLQSVTTVDMPCGNDYVTIMVVHPEDDDLKKLTTGMIFKRGQQLFREGKDGHATGNHFHMSAARGKFTGNGWVENNKGAWVITGKPIKPEQAFYVDGSTKILNASGLAFKKIPVKSPNSPVKYLIWVGHFKVKADAVQAGKKINNELGCYNRVCSDAKSGEFYLSVEYFSDRSRAEKIKGVISNDYQLYCEVRQV